MRYSLLRPRILFTAPNGWLNDPHGICWIDGEYHLFYQHVPAVTEWAPTIHWGHATSPDLIRWQHQPIALSPHPGEYGCWSGSTLIENNRPTIFYTSVPESNVDDGKIAIALPDDRGRHWTSATSDIVIHAPPAELGALSFRDPFLLTTEKGWTMIVGVGVAGGLGLAVQYHSTDRRVWTYGGVICSRSTDDDDGVWTGTMWECPQLLQVGDDWLLVVSVAANSKLHYVAAAVGAYNGSTFTPERWTRLTQDEISYAMTTFKDREGRACAMVWLRENPDHDPSSRPWASALSIPMVVKVNQDRSVRLCPHPDVDGLRLAVDSESEVTPSGSGCIVSSATMGLDVILKLDRRLELALTDQSATVLEMVYSADGVLVVERPGRSATSVIAAADSVRVIIDAGIVEVFAGSGSAAFRIPESREADLRITDATSVISIYRLRPAGANPTITYK